jgi:hypothetical protein
VSSWRETTRRQKRRAHRSDADPVHARSAVCRCGISVILEGNNKKAKEEEENFEGDSSLVAFDWDGSLIVFD